MTSPLLAPEGGRFSVAIPTAVEQELRTHLTREDGQEDLCFAIWHPSAGQQRTTACVRTVVRPRDGDRNLHGNVSFNSEFFMRAADEAARVSGGLALLHSHPGGAGWQGLSDDDFRAEHGHAGRASALTGLPLIGLTLATKDGTYSARLWERQAPRVYTPRWASTVRIVGDQLRLFWDGAGTQNATDPRLQRSVASWGLQVQQTLAKLHVGVAGAGSVGAAVVEALARSGVGRLTIVDYDVVKRHNLDRLLHATGLHATAMTGKAELAAHHARSSATYTDFAAQPLPLSVLEPAGLTALYDCDVIFSCVDGHAARAALNALAYAHLIPVVDGGVLVASGVRGMRGAEWRAHVAAPGRRCLECLGQYDPALVAADRDGLLDDPTYLAATAGHSVHMRQENVFAFSIATAAAEVLAALRMAIAPGGVADVGAQLFHFTTGDVDSDARGCNPHCPFPALVAAGDTSKVPVSTRDGRADRERAEVRELARRGKVRASRLARNVLWRASRAAESFSSRR